MVVEQIEDLERIEKELVVSEPKGREEDSYQIEL